MRMAMAAMLLLSCAEAVAGNEVFVVSRAFFDAIRFVESTDGRYYGDQDSGTVHGPYQISLAYLKDANGYLGKNYTLKDVIDSDDIAVEVMCAYWNRYLPQDREVTYELLARIHNGGPRGYEKESTVGYWNKVKAKMEEIENGKW